MFLVRYFLGLLFLTGRLLLADESPLFLENFEKGFHDWQPVKFEGRTSYRVVREGTNHFLLAQADRSASGLGVQFEEALDPNLVFSWKWKIDQIPPGGSDDTKSTFDHTARLFVAFDTFLGPPRTINYVWANDAKTGSTYHHPSSGRSRFIVLDSGNRQAGQWLSHSRDLAADYLLLFGDEDPPDIVAIGLMTDSDGTGTTVTGCYDDLLLRRK